MEPLDLTVRAPRNPWATLDGLIMMPRTIDKMRARLDGGKLGAYNVRGLSTRLLELIGVEEDALQLVIANANTDDDIRDWLRNTADVRKYALTNAVLGGLTVSALDATLLQRYPVLASLPPDTLVLDLLVSDDALHFGNEVIDNGVGTPC